MKIETRYICEICGDSSTNRKHIEACEGRKTRTQYPRGLIFGNHKPGAFYRDITFAVAVDVLPAKSHWWSTTMWACRDNGSGDSTHINDLCGSNNQLVLDKSERPDPGHPTFQRMVALLVSFGMKRDQLTVWDGEKPVSLDDFLKSPYKAI